MKGKYKKGIELKFNAFFIDQKESSEIVWFLDNVNYSLEVFHVPSYNINIHAKHIGVNIMNAKFKSLEERGTYETQGVLTDMDIMEMAMQIAKRKLQKGRALTSPDATFLALQTIMHEYEREVFGVVLLNAKHQIIKFVELFHGTIDSAAVYPREVVKLALANNASAMILVHNHPSGNPEPSSADRQLTTKLQQTLELIDVRVIDHIVLGFDGRVSFANRGWL